MQEGRTAKLILIVGAPGTGKTTFFMNFLKQVGYKRVLGLVSELNFYDKVFSPLKTIEKLSDYEGNWAKISDIGIEYRDMMTKVIGSDDTGFKNGAFFVDDAGEYEDQTVTPELKKLARMRRHIGVDIFYIYHGLTDIPIQLFKYTTHLVLFHTTDQADYKVKKIPRPDVVFAAKKKLETMYFAGKQYQPIIIKLS